MKGLYGQSDGDVTANNQSLAGLYRHDFTGRWYAYLNSEVGRDTIQFIDWRYLRNGGPGFRVVGFRRLRRPLAEKVGFVWVAFAWELRLASGLVPLARRLPPWRLGSR